MSEKSSGESTLAFERHFRCNFGQNLQLLGETFSGPETMDLEHDRFGFLVIFSQIAKFNELYLEFYWELEAK